MKEIAASSISSYSEANSVWDPSWGLEITHFLGDLGGCCHRWVPGQEEALRTAWAAVQAVPPPVTRWGLLGGRRQSRDKERVCMALVASLCGESQGKPGPGQRRLATF